MAVCIIGSIVHVFQDKISQVGGAYQKDFLSLNVTLSYTQLSFFQIIAVSLKQCDNSTFSLNF